MKITAHSASAALMMLAGVSGGAPMDFDFADPKGVNAIHILLDTPLEPIAGMAGGVSGQVKFDPEAPAKTAGYIEVTVANLVFANPMMTQVSRATDWLDVAQFPRIRFDVREVTDVKKLDDTGRYTARVKGDFQCRGVSKPLEVDVGFQYLPGRLGDRVKGASGDLLVLRAGFSVRRTDFGLKLDPDFLHVADEVQIRFGIAGQAARKP